MHWGWLGCQSSYVELSGPGETDRSRHYTARPFSGDGMLHHLL